MGRRRKGRSRRKLSHEFFVGNDLIDFLFQIASMTVCIKAYQVLSTQTTKSMYMSIPALS